MHEYPVTLRVYRVELENLELPRVHAHRVQMTGISVSAPKGGLFSIISDNSNSGVSLVIQDV